ncbi:MAG: bifunctional tetrahydrofolate synthase/dihydrofolate synthase [Gammaproteobacteria bacterium]|jgi:dihydrofolate synthase/folylpolyglutamate synthase|nr:bifunctional tetrahydrofolate synthase/dihydrofolate synthase [Gammaproteobacteria bacterium]
MRFRTIDDWLRWQESLHPRTIELGLERVAAVVGRMGWPAAQFAILTVGGTNGKGSTAAFLEAILEEGGYRTGAYTSPHLLRYNERVRLRREAVDDGALCEAFERVDRARGEVSLTYFEFGTLAAMDLFHRADLDAVVLEVGLGGRLDAVNVFEPDVAVVTTVDLDHQDWLGPDRESIGREKAGIFRPGRPAVCGDPDPPESLLAAARERAADLRLAGRDYRYQPQAEGWDWAGREQRLDGLPLPALRGRFQLQNAAAALAALEALAARMPVGRPALERGLGEARVPGRLEVFPGPVERILDVAHNPQGVRELAAFLAARPCAGATHALFAMLGDKDLPAALAAAVPVVDRWHLASLPGPRGVPAGAVRTLLEGLGLGDRVGGVYPDVETAYRALLDHLRPPDRMVVFGSFYTVGPALRVESSRISPDTLGYG